MTLHSLARLLALTAASLSVLSSGARVTSLLPPPPARSVIYNYTPVQEAADEALEADEALSFFFEEVKPKARHKASAVVPDTVAVLPTDSLLSLSTYEMVTVLPSYNLRPTVFDQLQVWDDSLSLATPDAVVAGRGIDPAIFSWINEEDLRNKLVMRARQHHFVYRPDAVFYNESQLPEPPKEFTAVIDPATASIVLKEVVKTDIKVDGLGMDIRKRHWLRNFNGSLQFSQAYVSPNWYQGGNNNLNALLNLYYNVKLNPRYHPKWIFENTFQYKLGVNNAPDDDLRDYSISEDLLQWNMTLGYKSARRWYYSLATTFKTQLLNNYKTNTNDMKAAFLSPGELNVGLGMTYSYQNPKKTFSFDASISPLSWNMKTCINRHMDVNKYGIKPGRKVVNEIGSSAEGKLSWKMCDNISLRSRLFVFTDYGYIQGDWENTIMFDINRFLTTQIYVHARYDSTTKRPEPESEWHKFQLKEILSFGISYKFAVS